MIGESHGQFGVGNQHPFVSPNDKVLVSVGQFHRDLRNELTRDSLAAAGLPAGRALAVLTPL